MYIIDFKYRAKHCKCSEEKIYIVNNKRQNRLFFEILVYLSHQYRFKSIFMKKSLLFSFVLTATAFLSVTSCMNGSKSKDYVEDDNAANDSTVAYPADSAIYGHLGEETGMSCIQLITENGDSLTLNKTDENTGEDGLILGEIANYTDRYAVIMTPDSQSVRTALNINQLVSNWKSVTDPSGGFRLFLNGKVKAISERADYKYNKWGLYNCRLILLRETNGEHGAETRNDTLEILSLTLDSMTVRHSRDQKIEKFYSIKPDEYGDR